MHPSKEHNTAKPKMSGPPVKDLRPVKDLKAGGQKKEDPTITAPPPPNIIAI